MSTFKQFIFSTVSADIEFDTLGSQTFVHPIVDYDLTEDFSIEEIINDPSIVAALTGGDITAKDENDVPVTDTNIKSILSKKVYDAVVDASGNGDYASIYDAFNSGFVQSIFVRDGDYAESENIVIPNGGSIKGESIDGVVVTFTGAKGFVVDSLASKETTGTISVSNGATAVVGVGTTFTNLSSGDHILVGNIFYEIDTITDDLNLDLVETYRGVSISDAGYIGQTMFSNVGLEDFTAIGDSANIIKFKGVRNSEIKNVRVFGSSVSNVNFVDCGSIRVESIYSQHSGADGFVMDECYTVNILKSDFSNNFADGITGSNVLSNISVDGCNIEANENGIITPSGGYDIRITNNKVSNNSQGGITIDSDTTVILSNSATGNGANGITIGSLSNNTIVGLNDTHNNADTDFINNGTDTEGVDKSAINTVTVNEKEDLPEPIGGVITLANSTIYTIHGNINIGSDRIAFGTNSHIIGNSYSTDRITYTGSDVMFTASGVDINIRNIGMSCGSGTVFNFSGVSSNFYMEYCVINGADTLGTVDQYNNFGINKCKIGNIASVGFAITGATNGRFTLYDSVIENIAGIAFDFGTSIQDVIKIDRNNFDILTTQTAISSSVPSTVVSSGGLLSGNIFKGVGTYISGITNSTTNWRFIGNFGDPTISDSTSVKIEVNTTDAAVTTIHTIVLPDDDAQYLYRVETVAMSDDQTEFGCWVNLISITKIAGVTVVRGFDYTYTQATGLKANNISAVVSGVDVLVQITGNAGKNIKWKSSYAELTKSINP